MSKATKKNEVVRVIEPELLDRADQAKLTALQMRVRSDIRHVQAHATALNGLAMCGNDLINLTEADAELARLEETVARARARLELLHLVA